MFVQIMLLLAVVTTGLSAGLFTAFAYAVMPGLGRGDDHSFVTAMRGINVAILNPVFLLIYLGPLLFGAAAAIGSLGSDDGPVLARTLAGLALYIALVVITAVVNIPLNNALEAGGGSDPGSSRTAFESRWNRSNAVRAGVSTASFVLFVLALVEQASA